MTEQSDNFLAEVIDNIEASYEFMLAYAAQGRDFESTGGASGPSIRKYLDELEKGLEKIVFAVAEKLAELDLEPAAFKAMDDFKNTLGSDADAALCAVKAVQSVPSISSQLIDNLNASAHLRCLLTDVFVIDEAIKLHQRPVIQELK